MSDPDPTPAEEQVRRLLADARHDEAIPTDVAARLDGVLADLRGEARRTAEAVDLAARRRRRVARNVLVAAAAVVVLGVGMSRVDLGSGGDDSGGSTAADAPESSALKSEAGADSDAGSSPRRPLVLHSDDFDRQVGRLRSGESLDVPPETLADGSAGDLGAAPPTWCDDPAWGAGERIRVRYDGERGVLVLRAPSDGSRAADLYLCGDTTPTRSTTVPAS